MSLGSLHLLFEMNHNLARVVLWAPLYKLKLLFEKVEKENVIECKITFHRNTILIF